MRNGAKDGLPLKIFFCVIGNVILAFGVAMAFYSAFGTDPFNSMCFSVSAAISDADLSYPIFTWSLNLLLFLFEIIWGRKYINIGTFINWVLLSFVANIFKKLLGLFLSINDPLYIRIPVFIGGVLFIALGVAIYQHAALGLSPYDCIPFLILDRTKKVRYFFVRMSLDCAAAAISIMAGGIGRKTLGIGTAIIALCLGPLIDFFTYLLFKKKKS